MIDLAGAVEHPDLCDAALSYLLERMRLEVEDPSEATRLKLMVVDEALALPARPRRAELPGRGGEDVASVIDDVLTSS